MMALSVPLTFLESLRLTVKSVLRQWCRVSEESMPEPYCGVSDTYSIDLVFGRSHNMSFFLMRSYEHGVTLMVPPGQSRDL